MAEAAFVLLVLLFALVGPLVLYYLVRAEHDRREEMDRESAERAARRDTGDRKR
jgi:multisubunit Na+/H+ antiporter MnhG subunit